VADITTMFWDMGGVILTNAWDGPARKRAAEKFQLDWDDFEGRHELMLDAFEKGQATLEEYLNRVVFYRSRHFTREEFKAFMCEQSQPFPESLAVLESVAAAGQYLLVALNNESLELNDYRIERFRLSDYFDVFLSSCFLGVRKPHRQIFQLALSITYRDPDECVFIDDRPLNLECAKELGMQTIQYQNPAQLQDELRRIGVSLPGKT
jgi:putative hydrolase of the HAD superfamily